MAGGERFTALAEDLTPACDHRQRRSALLIARATVEPIVQGAEAHVGGRENARDGEAFRIHFPRAADLIHGGRAVRFGTNVGRESHGFSFRAVSNSRASS